MIVLKFLLSFYWYKFKTKGLVFSVTIESSLSHVSKLWDRGGYIQESTYCLGTHQTIVETFRITRLLHV